MAVMAHGNFAACAFLVWFGLSNDSHVVGVWYNDNDLTVVMLLQQQVV